MSATICSVAPTNTSILDEGLTSKYKIRVLVHYEITTEIQEAIAREKQLKRWVRRKKVALIESANPEWKDLSEEWFEFG